MDSRIGERSPSDTRFSTYPGPRSRTTHVATHRSSLADPSTQISSTRLIPQRKLSRQELYQYIQEVRSMALRERHGADLSHEQSFNVQGERRGSWRESDLHQELQAREQSSKSPSTLPSGDWRTYECASVSETRSRSRKQNTTDKPSSNVLQPPSYNPPPAYSSSKHLTATPKASSEQKVPIVPPQRTEESFSTEHMAGGSSRAPDDNPTTFRTQCSPHGNLGKRKVSETVFCLVSRREEVSGWSRSPEEPLTPQVLFLAPESRAGVKPAESSRHYQDTGVKRDEHENPPPGHLPGCNVTGDNKESFSGHKPNVTSDGLTKPGGESSEKFPLWKQPRQTRESTDDFNNNKNIIGRLQRPVTVNEDRPDLKNSRKKTRQFLTLISEPTGEINNGRNPQHHSLEIIGDSFKDNKASTEPDSTSSTDKLSNPSSDHLQNESIKVSDRCTKSIDGSAADQPETGVLLINFTEVYKKCNREQNQTAELGDPSRNETSDFSTKEKNLTKDLLILFMPFKVGDGSSSGINKLQSRVLTSDSPDEMNNSTTEPQSRVLTSDSCDEINNSTTEPQTRVLTSDSCDEMNNSTTEPQSPVLTSDSSNEMNDSTTEPQSRQLQGHENSSKFSRKKLTNDRKDGGCVVVDVPCVVVKVGLNLLPEKRHVPFVCLTEESQVPGSKTETGERKHCFISSLVTLEKRATGNQCSYSEGSIQETEQSEERTTHENNPMEDKTWSLTLLNRSPQATTSQTYMTEPNVSLEASGFDHDESDGSELQQNSQKDTLCNEMQHKGNPGVKGYTLTSNSVEEVHEEESALSCSWSRGSGAQTLNSESPGESKFSVFPHKEHWSHHTSSDPSDSLSLADPSTPGVPAAPPRSFRKLLYTSFLSEHTTRSLRDAVHRIRKHTAPDSETEEDEEEEFLCLNSGQ